jgi:hypothetical protein
MPSCFSFAAAVSLRSCAPSSSDVKLAAGVVD